MNNGNKLSFMALFTPDREKERFYLLPGMGGRNLRRKQRVFLRWSLAAGSVVSAAVGALLYWLGTR
jgi:hypothetical protein